MSMTSISGSSGRNSRRSALIAALIYIWCAPTIEALINRTMRLPEQAANTRYSSYLEVPGSASLSTGTSLAFGGFLLARAISDSRRRKKKALGSSKPPQARRSDHTDDYFGHTVADPYRWMEQTDKEETKAWIEAQIQHTDAYFRSKLEPARGKFLARLREVFDFDKYSPPMREGDYWFFFLKKGLSPQAALYKQEGLDGTPEILLDPNTLSEDGTSALGGMDFSKDGKKLAYGISEKGSDWFTVHVRDVETGKDLPDRVPWCKFGDIVWEKASRGFFYSAFPPPKTLQVEGKSAGTEVEVSTGHRVMFHRLGTDSSEDQLVYQSPLDKTWLASAVMTDDWETLLISIGDSCDPVNRLFYRDLTQFDGKDMSTMGKVVKLVDNFDSLYSYVTNEGRTFWFRTNLDAPKYKVVRMQLPPVGSPLEEDDAALAQIPKTTVVAEDKGGVLTSAAVVAGDRLVLSFERDAYVQLELCDLHGADRKTIPVPGIGTIGGISTDKRYDHIMFSFTNFVTPGTIYHGTVSTSGGGLPVGSRGSATASPTATVKLEVFHETKVPGISSDDFETKQVRYKSKDGTQVPMFIVGNKNSRPADRREDEDEKENESPSPCLLYGYGGFNISLNPTFSASRLLFIKHFGGRYCLANIRRVSLGGGEYGEEWHNAGTLERKQNVFDDFVYAARYLVDKGYTTRNQLAIMGGSNGGLLVGACINQHPELVAAAVAQVGVMDMLRFDEFTIGYAWRSDFGSSKASEDQFKTLHAYSPLHNVRPDAPRYPAVLLTTGDHDDRVCPLHSYKYVAELQHTIGSRRGEKPLLIRIDKDSGHGGGKPTEKASVLVEASDTYAFIAEHTGATWVE
ncbi:unnamed protein product [Ascophyllum nodosum]